MPSRTSTLAALAVALVCDAALAQLRIVTWNVTNYTSNGTAPSNSRDDDFQTAVYGQVPAGLVLAGRSMSPDVFIGQEFTSQTAVNTFRALLNAAPGSPGDWAAAPFVNGADTDSALFYRTSKVQLLGTYVVAVGSSSTDNQPRNTMRYDIRPVGYATANASIGLYSVHLKAQGGTNDGGRRLIEAQRIRDSVNGVQTNGPGSELPAGFHYLVAGDMNITTSSAAEWQAFVSAAVANRPSRFFDPINTPGSWNNNGAFRYVHTQEQTSNMDDRFDVILVGAGLVDGSGLDYIGNASIPYRAYSSSHNLADPNQTWNDPNHSYRAWGNDGGSFNVGIRTAANTMVGPAIAQALINSASGNGHLPVYADFRVPARLRTAPAASSVIDFGQVRRGRPAPVVNLTVTNDGDVARWTSAGIATLNYSLSAGPGFAAPAGLFVNTAGQARQHAVSMPTATVGAKNATLSITHNAEAITGGYSAYMLIGEVLPYCLADIATEGSADLNAGPDSYVTGSDFDAFIVAFFSGFTTTDGALLADVATAGSGAPEPDGFLTGEDFDLFIQSFFAGCP